MRDDSVVLPPMEAQASPRDRCDICGTDDGVLVSCLSECWLNPNTGYLTEQLTFRGVYLCVDCVDCLEPDGGIISKVVADGFVVVRTGSESSFRGRIVVVQTTPWKA